MIDAASLSSEGAALIVAPTSHMRDSLLPTAMLRLPATLLSQDQDSGDGKGKRRRDTHNWSVSRRG